jgi:hypothetical protein
MLPKSRASLLDRWMMLNCWSLEPPNMRLRATPLPRRCITPFLQPRKKSCTTRNEPYPIASACQWKMPSFAHLIPTMYTSLSPPLLCVHAPLPPCVCTRTRWACSRCCKRPQSTLPNPRAPRPQA